MPTTFRSSAASHPPIPSLPVAPTASRTEPRSRSEPRKTKINPPQASPPTKKSPLRARPETKNNVAPSTIAACRPSHSGRDPGYRSLLARARHAHHILLRHRPHRSRNLSRLEGTHLGLPRDQLP